MNQDGIAGIGGIDIRQTILDLMPWKKPLKINEVEDLIKDHYKFTSEPQFANLYSRVNKVLNDLCSEGILERRQTISRGLQYPSYCLEHEYLAGR